MKFIENLVVRYRWTWVGTVQGRCVWKESGCADHVYWNLYVRGNGKRRADVVGSARDSGSAHVMMMLAAVRAWKAGGPLPELFTTPAPKRQPVKLVSLPGGKI